MDKGEGSKATIICGGFWGDEGKGKIVSYLGQKDEPAIIVRAGVGPNAGHTVFADGKRFALHLISGGFGFKKARLLIGAGVLVDPKKFLKEVEETNTKGRAFLDEQCAIIEEKHVQEDSKENKLGTTKTGCGPAAAERANRTAKIARDVPELKEFLTKVSQEVNAALDQGKQVLIEGTQGWKLSVYHGDYPFVTSKDVTASGLASDVGIGPTRVSEVIVTFKAYCSRVGNGPFPSEKPPEWAAEKGFQEFGTTTGRPRRIGEFDFEVAKQGCTINGATMIALTCLDKVYPEAKGAKTLDQLPQAARDFIKKVEDETKTPVKLVATGPNPEEIIDLR